MLQAIACQGLPTQEGFHADSHVGAVLATLAEGRVDTTRLVRSGRSHGPSAAWFEAVLDHLPTCVFMTDAEGFVTYTNHAAAQLAGRAPLIGADRWCVSHRMYAVDGANLRHDQTALAMALRERRPVRGVEAVLERPDATRVPVLQLPTPLFDKAGVLIGAFNLLIDISARKQAEKRLAEAFLHDALTGLPNRAALSEHLHQHISVARQTGESFIVMRVDVDGFKALNDTHGHGVGDAILVEVANRLGAGLGDAFLSRSGGDEFMLVSRSGSTEAEAIALAERVNAAFLAPFRCCGYGMNLTASAGCARFPDDGDDQIRLVAAANAALNLAKADGPGAVRMFDVAKQAREHERLAFRQALRAAIAAETIRLDYQPLFRADGSILGFEALARWDDPVRGSIAPTVFIAAAEEGGLIAALDSHILRSACREAASWTNPLRISVNVSALEFQSGDLPARVEAVLAETGLDPERLELEITESVMVTDTDRALTTFASLRGLGVRIALDDFGTGYSSLSSLHRFPLTTLKIDRSFVAKLGVTLESVAITRAVIQLGQALGMEVVAEGVETPEQLDFLIQEGCDLTQGFLLGRPLNIKAYAHSTGV